MIIRMVELEEKYDVLIDKLDRSQNQADIDDLSAQADQAEQQYNLIRRATDLSGTEKGRALNAQKMTINESYSLVSVKKRMKSAKKAELTKAEIDHVQKIIAESESKDTVIANLQKELNKLRAQNIVKNTAERFARLQNKPGRKMVSREQAVKKIRELLAAGCN